MEGNQSSWLGNFDDAPAKKDDEELLVFGYSCKLFRDDDRAMRVDQGKYLIPWMGDETHKIDRYDVRGYLNDLSVYEAKPINYLEVLTNEEIKLEQKCDEERYAALFQSVSEEDMYHEEELKRLKAALAEDGSYHEIGFSYNEDKKDVKEEVVEEEAKEPVEEPFKVPQELTVPTGMLIPETMKIHLIMEKTAAFVAQHGPQMEIVIKNKQSSNPQFQFLVFENSLNPYFKHLVSAIKSGRYQPKSAEEKGDSESDDDEDYLHPSLFASQSSSLVKIPDLPVFRSKQNDAYSKLVENLKDKVVKPPQNPPANVGFTNNWTPAQGSYPSQGTVYGQPPPPGDEALYHAFSNSLGSDLRPDQVVTPPLEVQSIVDKMAEYVVRSGDDFEAVVRRKQDKRFEFLNPDNQYHTYYIYKKTIFSEQKRVEAQQKIYEEREREKREKQAIALAAQNQYLPKESCGPVSFSLKAKEGELKDVKHVQLNADSDDESLKIAPNKITATGIKTESLVATGPSLPASAPRRSMFDVPPPSVSALLQPPVTTIPIAIIEELAAVKKSAEIAAEAKIAEEKLRDRLAAAARDKMAQQTRERLLQQERKRKAALFLNMIKSSAPQLVKPTPAENKSDTPNCDSTAQSKKQIIFGPHLENNQTLKRHVASGENGKHKSRGKSPSPVKASRSSRSHSRSYDRNSSSPPSSAVASRDKSHSSHHGGESHRRKSSFHGRSSHDRSSKQRTPPNTYSSHRSRSGSGSPKRRKRSKSRERSSRR